MVSLRLTRSMYDLSGANTIHQTLRATRSAYDMSSTHLRLTRSSHAIGASILPNSTHMKLVEDVTKAKAKLKTSRVALAQYSLIDTSPSSRAARETYTQAEREVEEACKAWCQAQRK